MSNGAPRRRSIFGGLLLVLIGVVFLLHYWAPGLIHLGRIWRYWPVLLIVWGLAKIYDHFAAERTSQLPPRVMTGGEFLLLMLILALGGTTVLFGWARRNRPDLNISINPFEHPYSFSQELPAKPVKASASIAIITRRGNITVHGEEAPELRIVATKTVSSSSEGDASQRAQKISVDIREVPGGYQVEPEIPEGDRGIQVSLEVHAPKRVTLSAKTDRGDVQVSDLAGPITAASARGDIEIHNAGGEVNADLEHGDARILGARGNVRLTGRGGELELADIAGTASIEGEYYGPIRARNVAKTVQFLSSRTNLTIVGLPGRMEMDSGRLEIDDSPGSVSLTTRNKDIEMENIAGRISLENRHGDIAVRFSSPPHEEISIRDESGSVELVLPEKTAAEITALAHSGDVECDFKNPELKLTQTSDNSQLSGKLGMRGPQIHITTTYGTIRLRKAA